MTGFRVGVDIGGTFTDIVFLGEDGERITRKVSSTVDNYAAAIADGLAEQILAERGLGRRRDPRIAARDDGRLECDPGTARERAPG